MDQETPTASERAVRFHAREEVALIETEFGGPEFTTASQQQRRRRQRRHVKRNRSPRYAFSICLLAITSILLIYWLVKYFYIQVNKETTSTSKPTTTRLNMDDDDDLYMIIIDGESSEIPRPLKLEPTEEFDEQLDLELILRNAKTNGQYLGEFSELIEEGQYSIDEIKEGRYSSIETGSDTEEDNFITDIKIERIEEEFVSDSDESDKRRNKSRPKVSYVAQLQKNFPKMRRDEESLVSHLTELMKHTKPPPPPIGFCKNVDGQLVCSFCFAVSSTLPIAGRHYQKKHGTRYLTCYACGADFKCTTGLYKHEKRCPSKGARIVLMARGRYLGRKGKQRPYLTLGKFDPWDLNNPKKRHHCTLCEADFATKEALDSHVNAHRGIRPYQCDRCPAACTNIGALKRHLEARHSDKRFICDTCDRSFKTKTSLISHMNTHLPPKHLCDRCDRRFAQKSSLRNHIERDHLHIPPPHACTECPRRFPRLFNLKCHLKKAHGMTLMTRQVFLKALPNMKEEELQKATFVYNIVEDNAVENGNPNAKTLIKNVEQISAEKDQSDHVCLDITYRTPEMPKSEKKAAEEIGDPYLETFEYGVLDDNEITNSEEGLTITSGTALDNIDNPQKEYLSFQVVAQEQMTKQVDEEIKTEMLASPIVKKELDAQLADIIMVTPAYKEINESIPIDAETAEEVPGTPNDVVIRTILPENCEIEFASIGERAGEAGNTIEGERSATLTEIDENTTNFTNFKIGEINVQAVKTNRISEDSLNGPKNEFPSVAVNKDANVNKDCKRTETANKKVNFRKAIGTRSNAMKTRSGLKIYANENIATRSKT